MVGQDGVQAKEDETTMSVIHSNPPTPLMGQFEPDPVGEMLGTWYMKFQSPTGIGGLAKWSDERLDLLAVHASFKGKGQFREFIRIAKHRFKTICVWEDMNPIMGPMLRRYGFSPETEIQGWGEAVSGWRWDRPA